MAISQDKPKHATTNTLTYNECSPITEPIHDVITPTIEDYKTTTFSLLSGKLVSSFLSPFYAIKRLFFVSLSALITKSSTNNLTF